MGRRTSEKLKGVSLSLSVLLTADKSSMNVIDLVPIRSIESAVAAAAARVQKLNLNLLFVTS